MSRRIADMFTLPHTISVEYFDQADMFSREGIWQLCWRDLRGYDVRLRNMAEISELSFHEETVFPDTLQRMADQVLEEGKKHRLNSPSLTGRGVKTAVIDRPIRRNHAEFRGRLEYIRVCPEEDTDTYDFHGMACAGFLCGASCGVAGEAELVYFAIPNQTADRKRYYGYQLKALEKVYEYNRHASSPIRIVSLSAPFLPEQMEQRNILAARLAETGCALADAAGFMQCAQGIDYAPYDAEPKYLLNRWQTENAARNQNREGFTEYFRNLCCIPSARRTSPANDSDTAYIHWSKAVSESWTIPHWAGAYAVCLEYKKDLSYTDFTALARKCPRKNGFVILDINDIVSRIRKNGR